MQQDGGARSLVFSGRYQTRLVHRLVPAPHCIVEAVKGSHEREQAGTRPNRDSVQEPARRLLIQPAVKIVPVPPSPHLRLNLFSSRSPARAVRILLQSWLGPQVSDQPRHTCAIRPRLVRSAHRAVSVNGEPLAVVVCPVPLGRAETYTTLPSMEMVNTGRP